ncbi:MAG: sensor histidine kinase, partial [Melioribacteraceae bacterium]|nr:sensor histidine kinase [Melioribacteraceae bacterium]
INEDDLENIFESFIRTQNAVNISGSGLGLSIVKEAVELHSGKIEVESKINEGSTFKIIIPIVKENKS